MPKTEIATNPVPAGYQPIAGYPTFSAADIERIASAVNIEVNSPNYEKAADEITKGIQSFALASQNVSSHADYRVWFDVIFQRSAALLSLFGDLTDSSNSHQIYKNFAEYGGLELDGSIEKEQFISILGGLRYLQNAAEKARATAKADLRPGRPTAHPRIPLGNGLRGAWLALTGRETGGITTPTQDDRNPCGPFIDFARAILTEAQASDLSLPMEIIQRITANPWAVAELQKVARRR